MNNDNDDIEYGPVSVDEPVDWYFDGVGEGGYATECVVVIFGEYLRKHDLGIRMCGVSFDGMIPKVKSDELQLELFESDSVSKYAKIKLIVGDEVPEECCLRMKFDGDFAFSFFETDADGNIIDLDYCDDYCMK